MTQAAVFVLHVEGFTGGLRCCQRALRTLPRNDWKRKEWEGEKMELGHRSRKTAHLQDFRNILFSLKCHASFSNVPPLVHLWVFIQHCLQIQKCFIIRSLYRLKCECYLGPQVLSSENYFVTLCHWKKKRTEKSKEDGLLTSLILLAK